MAKFLVIEIAEAIRSGRWTIEKVVPGEKPMLISFFRSRAAATAEAHRLNLYGRGELQPVTKVRHTTG
jgi:hypothetical protein